MLKLLTATEAANLLKVKPATLYAYVSRGLLQPVATKGANGRRYRSDEVSRLGRQKSYGHQPRKAAGEALHLGFPVLESSLSLIEDGNLYYRGWAIADIARTHRLEDVARLLWGCETIDPFRSGIAASRPRPRARTASQEDMSAIAARCIEALAAQRWDESKSVWQACARALRLVAGAVLQRGSSSKPIDRQCAIAWGLDEIGQECVRAGLVVCADHELNVSAFTARCAASCGASMSAAVIAGLAALSGSRHGGYSERVEATWDKIEAGASIAKGIRAMAERGENIPGFWHPLYPGADPRCAALFTVWKPHRAAQRIADEVFAHTGALPTIDFGLVALRRGLGLPRGTAAKIFAIARTVGWIAHALEQRLDDRLIRPRSRYVGLRPQSARPPETSVVRTVKF